MPPFKPGLPGLNIVGFGRHEKGRGLLRALLFLGKLDFLEIHAAIQAGPARLEHCWIWAA
jgi:hypothetical protein